MREVTKSKEMKKVIIALLVIGVASCTKDPVNKSTSGDCYTCYYTRNSENLYGGAVETTHSADTVCGYTEQEIYVYAKSKERTWQDTGYRFSVQVKCKRN